MGVGSKLDSFRPSAFVARLARFTGIAFLLVLSLRGGGEWLGTARASADFPFDDSDVDGLSNAVEAYLSQVSTDPALAANPFDSDTDGDGQLDGFEYCLSNRLSVVSPGVVQPVVPKITLGSHQEGEYLVLTIYVIPGDVSLLSRFRFGAAGPSASGQIMILDATELLVDNIGMRGSATLVRSGPHSMAVYQARASVALLSRYSSVAFAALAEVAGVAMGDSATFTVHHGTVYRWTYRPETDPSGDGSDGEGEPQQESGSGSEPQKLCISTEVSEPTGIPGVMVSMPISTRCESGNWLCDPTVCTDGGPASQPKVVLDHLQLLW